MNWKNFLTCRYKNALPISKKIDQMIVLIMNNMTLIVRTRKSKSQLNILS